MVDKLVFVVPVRVTLRWRSRAVEDRSVVANERGNVEAFVREAIVGGFQDGAQYVGVNEDDKGWSTSESGQPRLTYHVGKAELVAREASKNGARGIREE